MKKIGKYQKVYFLILPAAVRKYWREEGLSAADPANTNRRNTRHMKKKITAAALALCLVLGLLPMSALAAQYKATLNGQAITIDVDDATGKYEEKTVLEHYSLAPGTITLTNGKLPNSHEFTFSYYGQAPDALTIPVTGTLVESAATSVRIGLAAETTEIFGGKTASDLGSFQIASDTASGGYKVTGTAKYIAQSGFNAAHPEEEKGHYLCLAITGGAANGTVTITNNSSGASEGKTLALDENGSIDTMIWLDGSLMDSYASTNLGKTFKINDIVVDFSDVVLEAEVKTTDTSVTVSAGSEVADLLNAENDNQESVNQNAPVKVEGTDSSKTLVFTGKTGAESGTEAPKQDNTVQLDKELVTAITDSGNSVTAAAVKVESSTGSVEVPTSVLNADAAKANGATIEVKKAELTTGDVPADTDAAVKTAITGAANAVSVTAAANGANLLPKKDSYTDSDPVVTITINGLTAGKTYVVLCIVDNALTSFGRFESITATSLTIGSRHLSTYIPVEETDANKAALAAVTEDPGAVNTETPVVSSIKITSVKTDIAPFTKVQVTGLKSDKVYLIRIGAGTGKAGQAVFYVDNATSYDFYCNADSTTGSQTVMIWELNSKADIASGKMPAPAAAETVTKVS